MRRILCAALAACMLAAGCGGTRTVTHTVTERAAPFACHHKTPAQLGECVRQELGPTRGVAPPTANGRAQGIDISNWQPHPDFRQLYRQGTRFVIVQASDNGGHSNRYFGSQVRGAHAAGMRVGVYIFVEGNSAAYQANTVVNVAAPYRSLITLGAHVDAEVSSAYSHACGVAAILAQHFHIVSLYSSPGLWFFGRCVGYAWPAEWSSGPAYPLNGYPASAVKLRQWCGTCYMAGNSGQIDRDEDLGLLELSRPAPVPLRVLYARRHALRGLLNRHHCRQPPWHAALPTNYAHAWHVWLAEGARVNHEIRSKGGR